MEEKKAAIFCSASYVIDPKYNDLAREVVRALHSKGYTIVSGGAIKGTMGVISDEAARIGATHIGIMPRFMAGLEHSGVSKLFWTSTMAERKEGMREGTCLALALPGGIGTLDELIETLVLAKLGKYPGNIVALDYDGFYTPLKDLLDHYVDTRMLDEDSRALISFPKTVEELLDMI